MKLGPQARKWRRFAVEDVKRYMLARKDWLPGYRGTPRARAASRAKGSYSMYRTMRKYGRNPRWIPVVVKWAGHTKRFDMVLPINKGTVRRSVSRILGVRFVAPFTYVRDGKHATSTNPRKGRRNPYRTRRNPRSLALLKRDAKEHAEMFDHRLGNWRMYGKRVAVAGCEKCGKSIAVTSQPGPRGIDIGGPLSAEIRCKYPSPWVTQMVKVRRPPIKEAWEYQRNPRRKGRRR